MADPGLMERAFLAELDFECALAIDAWTSLLSLAREPEQGLVRNTVEYILARWSHVDNFLVHVVRIDRMINPTPGHDSPWSFAERVRLAALVRDYTGRELLRSEGINTARNIVEHLVEYLPTYLKDAGDSLPGPFAFGPDVLDEAHGQLRPVRALDPFSGECEVMGHRLNLKSLLNDVRALKVALPGRSLWGQVQLARTLATDAGDRTIAHFDTGDPHKSHTDVDST